MEMGEVIHACNMQGHCRIVDRYKSENPRKPVRYIAAYRSSSIPRCDDETVGPSEVCIKRIGKAVKNVWIITQTKLLNQALTCQCMFRRVLVLPQTTSVYQLYKFRVLRCLRRVSQALNELPFWKFLSDERAMLESEAGRTFVRRHHFSCYQLLKCIVALDIQCQCLHEAMFGLVTAVELEHKDPPKVAHRCFHLLDVSCRIIQVV